MILAFISIDSNKVDKFFGNNYFKEIAWNGIYQLFSAYRNNQIDYDQLYATQDEKKALANLRNLISKQEPSSKFLNEEDISRLIAQPKNGTEKKYNVILVAIESLSEEFLQSFGSEENITPNLDRLAKEGLFFIRAGDLNKNNVPAKALWIQAFWASVLCLSGSYGSLLDYCTFASLVFYIVTISAIFYLRKIEPNTPRPYKAFGYPIIPALYILIATAICVDLLIFKPQNTFLGLGIMALGIPIYYYFSTKDAANKISK